MSRRNAWIAGVCLLSLSAMAIAYQEVEVNDLTYGCENVCRVTSYPGGGFMIRDSRGGYCVLVQR